MPFVMKGNPHFAANRRRRPRPKPRAPADGFPRLVLAIAALTFLGVFGMLSPNRIVADPAIASSDEVIDAYYPNCDEARAAGAAPLRRGEPGYRARLDRDRDGIACEPYY